jgi:hypothetical protein
MNGRIERNGFDYVIIIEGKEYEAYIWEEPGKYNKDGSKKYHVRMKDKKIEQEIFGKYRYFSKPKVDASISEMGYHEFGESIERTVGGWKEALTTEELAELKEAEETIERLKKVGMERKSTPMTEKEKLQRDIERMMKKLAKLEEES